MKTAILIFLISAAWTVSAQTNEPTRKKHAAAAILSVSETNENICCRYPLRVFGSGATANLTPLFKWWSQHASDAPASLDGDITNSRPLAAWHRIIGEKVTDTGYSWVVEAEVYTNPGVRLKERIFLKNPPTAEEQLFYSLKTELAAAIQQMTNDQRAYQSDTRAAQRAETRAQTVRVIRKKNQANPAQTASQDQQVAADALTDQQQLAQAVPLAQKRLNAIPSKNGRYVLDCFALAAGKTKEGVPIYDLGGVDVNSP